MQDYTEELMEQRFEEFDDDHEDYEDFYGDEGCEM